MSARRGPKLNGGVVDAGSVATCHGFDHPSSQQAVTGDRSILPMRLLPRNPVTPALACVGGFLLTGAALAALLAIAGGAGVSFAELPIARVVGFIGNALLWLGIARAWTHCTKPDRDRKPSEP